LDRTRRVPDPLAAEDVLTANDVLALGIEAARRLVEAFLAAVVGKAVGVWAVVERRGEEPVVGRVEEAVGVGVVVVIAIVDVVVDVAVVVVVVTEGVEAVESAVGGKRRDFVATAGEGEGRQQQQATRALEIHVHRHFSTTASAVGADRLVKHGSAPPD